MFGEGIAAGEALEGRGFVMIVMVDVRVRMGSQVEVEELHEFAKRYPFFSVVVRRKRSVFLLPLLEKKYPKQVLEPARVVRIALHVKEQITGILLWQSVEAATRLAVDDFYLVLSRSPLVSLKCGLRA